MKGKGEVRRKGDERRKGVGGAVYGYTCCDRLHTLYMYMHTCIVCTLDAGFLNGMNSCSYMYVHVHGISAIVYLCDQLFP